MLKQAQMSLKNHIIRFNLFKMIQIKTNNVIGQKTPEIAVIVSTLFGQNLSRPKSIEIISLSSFDHPN